MIIIYDNKPIRLQIKAYTSKNGAIIVKSTKDGPNYHFQYQSTDFDFFAIYVLDKDIVLIVSSKIVDTHQTLTIRIDEAKNQQKEKINHYTKYNDIERILRDYTQNILTEKAEDDDIVQTTKK